MAGQLLQQTLTSLVDVKVAASVVLPFSLAESWEVARRWGSSPYIQALDGVQVKYTPLDGAHETTVGATRQVSIGGSRMFEKLVSVDDEECALKWRIVSHPGTLNPFGSASFVNYVARLDLKPVSVGNHTFVQCKGAFCTEPAFAELLQHTLERWYLQAFQGLQARAYIGDPDYILAQRKRAAQPAIGSLEAHTAHQNASQAGSTPSLAYLAPQQPQQRQQPPSFLPRVSQMQQWQDSAVPSQQSGASSSDNIPSPMSAAGQADGQGAGFPLPLMQGRAPFGEQPRRVPPSPFGRVQRDPNSRAKGHNSSEDGSDRYDGGESNSNSDGSGSDSNGSSGGQRGMPMQT